MSQQRLHAAVAAGVLGVEARHSDLLQSIVDVARAIFGARAASIMFYDVDQHELVFEAVSGEGHDSLVGQRIPAGTGIAGWVLASQEPMVVEDVTANPSFSLATAESTGYVPKGLMAVPLLLDGDTLGVLNVLDRPARTKFSVEEMDLLELRAPGIARAVGRARGAPRPACARRHARRERRDRATCPHPRRARRHATRRRTATARRAERAACPIGADE